MRRFGKIIIIPVKGHHRNMHMMLGPHSQSGNGLFGSLIRAGSKLLGKAFSSNNVKQIGNMAIQATKEAGKDYLEQKKGQLIQEAKKRGEDVVKDVLAGKNIKEVAKMQASDIQKKLKDLPRSEANEIKRKLVKTGKSRLSDAISQQMMSGRGVNYV